MTKFPERSRGEWRSRWTLSQRSPRTRETYERGIDAWFVHIDRLGVDLWDIEPHHVDSYRHSLQDLGRSAATINRELSTVSSFYRHVLRRGRPAPIERNPVEWVDRVPRAIGSKSVALDVAETEAIRAVSIEASPRTAAVVHLLLGTAARISEVCNATVSDLSDPGDGGRLLTVTRKGGVRGQVTIPETEWAVVEHYLTTRTEVLDGWLLASTGGRRMTRQTAYRIVVGTAQKVTTRTTVGPHDLRHTTATQLLDAGESVQEVRGMLGHASVATTELYDRSASSRGRGAARRLSASYADRAAAAAASLIAARGAHSHAALEPT